MRVFVFITLFVFVSLPVFIFHFVPERWLQKGISQVEEQIDRGVHVSVNKIERAFPARLHIDNIQIGYKNKGVLDFKDTEIRLNPYLLYFKSIGVAMNSELYGGEIEAEGLLSLDNIKGCLKAESIPVHTGVLARYLRAVKRAIVDVEVCRENAVAFGEVDVHNIKMEDLPYRDIIFPASRIKSMAAAFKIKDDRMELEAVKIEADGYEAVLSGTLKRRNLNGTVLIYADKGFREDEFGRLNAYRVSERMYIIPVESLDIIHLLEKKKDSF